MYPRHLEMATSAALEADGRARVLSARYDEIWSYIQEMGHKAMGGHNNKKQLVPSYKESSYSESNPILKLPSGRWPDQKSIFNQW